ncbi:MAG TPA: glucose-1-phosphate thymidylyltransferase [Pseudonocardiaceae bacterium]|nr:glucose-1-phosphate thymidylyltransferase [Pseudonocardiaceae bacterium]
MKALVLSGGSGTRLRPFSYSMPKQLIPIANKPVLEHVIDNIRSAGVTDVGVIVGQWAEQIADALGDGSRFGVRITYLRQDHPRGLAHTVQVARPFLTDDDFVMYLGDIMLPDGVASFAADFRAHRPAAQVVVHRVADPTSFGVVELDDDGCVRGLVEKPSQPKSDLAIAGVYFFTPDIHQAVDAIPASARGELEITDAIQWLLSNGFPVGASEYTGYWKDTGRIEDVLACNRRMLAKLARAVPEDVGVGSELVGQVVVEPGATIVRSRVEGPVIVGADTVIEDSQIGPNTSIGRGCVLRSSRLADSIVLAGASIVDVNGLHSSLIGRGASIGRDNRGGVGYRLVVGDHTRIELEAA